MANSSANSEEDKDYLGDGVYVCKEDGMLKLTTENGVEVTNTIYLEVPVFLALVRYAKRQGVQIDG